MVRETGQPIETVARNLGVSSTTLGNWVKADRVERGEAGPEELTASEREELRRLRRENAQLRMEREILKKAAAFFAQESTR
jgi:transposase